VRLTARDIREKNGKHEPAYFTGPSGRYLVACTNPRAYLTASEKALDDPDVRETGDKKRYGGGIRAFRFLVGVLKVQENDVRSAVSA